MNLKTKCLQNADRIFDSKILPQSEKATEVDLAVIESIQDSEYGDMAECVKYQAYAESQLEKLKQNSVYNRTYKNQVTEKESAVEAVSIALEGEVMADNMRQRQVEGLQRMSQRLELSYFCLNSEKEYMTDEQFEKDENQRKNVIEKNKEKFEFAKWRNACGDFIRGKTKFISVIGFLAALLVVGISVFFLVEDSENAIMYILGGLIGAVVIWGLSRIIKNKIDRKNSALNHFTDRFEEEVVKVRSEKLTTALEELRKIGDVQNALFQSAVAACAALSEFVPSEFRDSYSLGNIKEMLQSGRADNLKEAYNTQDTINRQERSAQAEEAHRQQVLSSQMAAEDAARRQAAAAEQQAAAAKEQAAYARKAADSAATAAEAAKSGAASAEGLRNDLEYIRRSNR